MRPTQFLPCSEQKKLSASLALNQLKFLLTQVEGFMKKYGGKMKCVVFQQLCATGRFTTSNPSD